MFRNTQPGGRRFSDNLQTIVWALYAPQPLISSQHVVLIFLPTGLASPTKVLFLCICARGTIHQLIPAKVPVPIRIRVREARALSCFPANVPVPVRLGVVHEARILNSFPGCVLPKSVLHIVNSKVHTNKSPIRSFVSLNEFSNPFSQSSRFQSTDLLICVVVVFVREARTLCCFRPRYQSLFMQSYKKHRSSVLFRSTCRLGLCSIRSIIKCTATRIPAGPVSLVIKKPNPFFSKPNA